MKKVDMRLTSTTEKHSQSANYIFNWISKSNIQKLKSIVVNLTSTWTVFMTMGGT